MSVAGPVHAGRYRITVEFPGDHVFRMEYNMSTTDVDSVGAAIGTLIKIQLGYPNGPAMLPLEVTDK